MKKSHASLGASRPVSNSKWWWKSWCRQRCAVSLPPVVLGLAVLGAPAYAEEAASTLPVIEVSADKDHVYSKRKAQAATKTDTPVLETPFSVQVVPRELLEERLAIDLAPALETVSGVAVGYGGGFSSTGRAMVRGFSNISNFKDGFRINTTVTELDLANVEQLEVLKGPASALYGRFEPGGIINLVTKKPSAEPRLGGKVIVGPDDFLRGTIDIGRALNDSGSVSYRLNSAYERSNGFRDFTDYDKKFFAPAIRFDLSDRTQLTLQAEYLKLDSAFDRGLPNHPISFTLPNTRNLAEPWMRADKEQLLASAELLHQINDQWRARAAFLAQKADVEEAYFNYGFFAPVIGRNAQRTFFKGEEEMTDRTWQAELYGQVETGLVRHKLLFGLEHNYDAWEYVLRSGGSHALNIDAPVYGANPPEAAYVPSSAGTSRWTTLAGYFQDELALGEHWRLLLGARWDRIRASIEDPYFGPSPAERKELTTFAPRVGLTFMPTSSLSLYASWARSTRLDIGAGQLATGELPDPTRGTQIEIGAKASLLNDRIRPTLAFFEITKDDALVSDPVDFNFVVPVGKVKSRGVELDVSVQATRKWNLTASWSHINAYIDEDTDSTRVGNQLQNVPKRQASLWTTYNMSALLPGLMVGGGMVYVGERPTTVDNTLFLSSYRRWDAYASWQFDRNWQAQLNLRNLTDEDYYMVSGFGMVLPQPGRQAFLSVAYEM